MPIRVFGLTGGVASGKSAVAERLGARGVAVIDADQVARDVVQPGTSALAEIAASFGSEVLGANGSLDRQRLGAIVFADPDARRRLEAIVHPRIAAETARRIGELEARGVELCCYDAALLVERGLAAAFRPLVVVSAPRAIQRQRLMTRDGLDAAQADARILAQAPLSEKIAAADLVIDNQGTFEDLAREVDRVLDRVRSWPP